MYDEELPMKMLFDKILVDNPDNLKIQIENVWLIFSEAKDKYFVCTLFFKDN
jgi:hypothetical protein